MANVIRKEDLYDELRGFCVEIAQNFTEEGSDEFLAARERGRYSMDLMVKYLDVKEPQVEGFALDAINKELFAFYANLGTGEIGPEYIVKSWDDLYHLADRR